MRRRWEELPGADRAAWVALIVGAVVAFGYVFASGDADAPEQVAAPSSLQPADGGATEAEPSCDEAGAPSEAEPRITCRRGDTLVTLAAAPTAVTLDSTALRLLRATRSETALTTRVRLRNGTEREQTLDLGGDQVALRIGETKLSPREREELTIPAKAGRTTRLRFDLDSDARRLLEQDKPVELTIVPWDEVGQDPPRRLGVLRIDDALQ